MASTKAGGSTRNLRDSNPKYLGVKRAHGQKVGKGMVIVRQRGTKILPGKGVSVGKDHTIFARIDGLVSFKNVRKTNFDGQTKVRKQVSVV